MRWCSIWRAARCCSRRADVYKRQGLYCAPVAVVGALIGELVMWGKDSYHDIKRVVGGYIVYWVTFGFYGIMPYLLFRDAYMEQLGTCLLYTSRCV